MYTSLVGVKTKEEYEYDENEQIAEITARNRRKEERKTISFVGLSNEEKLELIRRWYPRVYASLKMYYPGLFDDTENYPGIQSVNSMIRICCRSDGMNLSMV